jgi:GntR family transcriptional repressor for pyruvate dehydrogenase complex
MSGVVHDSVSLEVSRRLLDLLVSGEVQVGSRLPSERDLATQLGVGRNAVRDGLRPLNLLGILEVRPGSGTYVKSTTSDLLPEALQWGLMLGEPTLQELLEARHVVEVALSGQAAERRSARTVKVLRSILTKMETDDPDDFMKADLAFHERIAAAASNQVLATMCRNIRTLTAVWLRLVVTARPPDQYLAEHVAIADAIEAQDSEAARAAMDSHLKIVIKQVSEGFAAQRDGLVSVHVLASHGQTGGE